MIALWKAVSDQVIFPRSGSTLTGHLLTQGRRAPNYVFEPIAYFNGKDLPEHRIAPEFRAELMSVFETGRPKKSHNSFLPAAEPSGLWLVSLFVVL